MTHHCRDGGEGTLERGLTEFDDVVMYRCTRPSLGEWREFTGCGTYFAVVDGEASVVAGTTMGEAQ